MDKRLARVGFLLLLIGLGFPTAGSAAPCKGATRLQLRWSQRTLTSLVSFSATACEAPPACKQGRQAASPPAVSRTAGGGLTKPPFTVAITDAARKTITGQVNPNDPACGTRCVQFSRAACASGTASGTDGYRMGGSVVRYLVSGEGQTTVIASKLTIATPQQPSFTPPLQLTVTDANGYAVAAELANCRVRQSASGVAITCSK